MLIVRNGNAAKVSFLRTCPMITLPNNYVVIETAFLSPNRGKSFPSPADGFHRRFHCDATSGFSSSLYASVRLQSTKPLTLQLGGKNREWTVLSFIQSIHKNKNNSPARFKSNESILTEITYTEKIHRTKNNPASPIGSSSFILVDFVRSANMFRPRAWCLHVLVLLLSVLYSLHAVFDINCSRLTSHT
jgi:hypothetical protein